MESFCCRRLSQAIETAIIPFEFDLNLSEFRLSLTIGGYAPIEYCPFCGRQFPPSKRDSLFCEPVEEEIAQIENLTAINDLDELCQRLGKPSEVIESEHVYQYCFANWTSVELIVLKDKQPGAKLQYITHPKMRENTKQDHSTDDDLPSP